MFMKEIDDFQSIAAIHFVINSTLFCSNCDALVVISNEFFLIK